ncbi:MAG: DUF4169 family protein [Rhodobacter sp.]|nr:DUF4169 family protein [Rhodobacter sp.]
MSIPINLNRARKERDKIKKRLQADENTVKYGRSKAERILEAAQNEKARRSLDLHRTEDE